MAKASVIDGELRRPANAIGRGRIARRQNAACRANASHMLVVVRNDYGLEIDF